MEDHCMAVPILRRSDCMLKSISKFLFIMSLTILYFKSCSSNKSDSSSQGDNSGPHSPVDPNLTVRGDGDTLTILNSRSEPIWLILKQNDRMIENGKKLNKNETYKFESYREGFYSLTIKVKLKCDDSGQNCQVGQVENPCPKDNYGCSPDFGTKAEFTFGCFKDPCVITPQGHPLTSEDNYNLSAVDGYSIPMTITVNKGNDEGPHCKNLDASLLKLASCPEDFKFNGDTYSLKVENPRNKNEIIGCYSPQGFLTGSTIWGGLAKKANENDVINYTCASPMTPEKCRAGPVKMTPYYKTILQANPDGGLYGFAYDDDRALHKCLKEKTKYTLEIQDEK